MLAPFVFKIKMRQVLRTFCWVLLCVLLRSTYGSIKFNFSTGILLCMYISIQSSQVYFFLLAAFVFISYLTHFAVTTLVIFAELCILLCYEVFALKISVKGFNLRVIFVRHFVCLGPILCELSILFAIDFTFFH